MRVLVIGGGGREHALTWKLVKDNPEVEFFVAPGNGGTEALATNVDIEATDIPALLSFAKEKEIDTTIVGMDDPLAMGIVNEFEKEGLRIFGPTQKAAQIEASKVYSKGFMKKYGIPTADYQVFSDVAKANEYIKTAKYPLVIKADGLAYGKGVIICEDKDMAETTLEEIMVEGLFGDSGNEVVIEEFLEGQEMTVLAFCDGKDYELMPCSQDHKQAFDGDKGPNTGGMGAIAPCPLFTDTVLDDCVNEIFSKTMKGFKEEDVPFTGFLYFGLMLTDEGPQVIEYNARMGDPETQVIVPLLKSNLLTIIDACIDGKLKEIDIEWFDKSAMCVVAASGGYPGSSKQGYEISGLEESDDTIIFHAGTKKEQDSFITSGGRVLGVVGIGETLEEARDIAYAKIETVSFTDMFYRKDIGGRVL